jgi:cytochrome c556
MKKTNILILAAISMLATVAFNSFAAGDKEDSTISKTMKAHFKGDTSDIKKAAKGELSKDEVAKLVTAVKALSSEKPPEGDAADYKKKNDALVAALEKLASGAEGAGAAVKEAANCKACHEAHKPK